MHSEISARISMGSSSPPRLRNGVLPLHLCALARVFLSYMSSGVFVSSEVRAVSRNHLLPGTHPGGGDRVAGAVVRARRRGTPRDLAAPVPGEGHAGQAAQGRLCSTVRNNTFGLVFPTQRMLTTQVRARARVLLALAAPTSWPMIRRQSSRA